MSISPAQIASKAEKVTQIFNILSWVILITGGLAVAGGLLAGFLGLFGDNGLAALMAGLGVALGAAIYTALLWAWISLAVIVAGYISNRSA
ncbi:MAG: hypothetical protein OEU98_06555 [Actinomycetota bacterium]|nr:hypothetical protein [Actinomycetota bacterium]